jgi:acyl-CoA synthetase (AMP-forming)/AMP-acid ligase II
VYTTEVERVSRTAPGVGEAAVIGLPDPDWGELVCAVIVPSGDTFSDAEPTSTVAPGSPPTSVRRGT